MPDAAYAAAGARIAPSAADVFAESELVVKVKELQPHKRGWLRPCVEESKSDTGTIAKV